MNKFFKKITNFIGKHALVSFFILLAILLGLLFASKKIKEAKQKEALQPETKVSKEVGVYEVGEFPYVKVQAQIDKAGIVTVVAQTGGVVQKVYVNEGQAVKRGNWLVGLSTNYQGSSVQTVSRQLAQKQYDNFVETYDDQKDLLKKQKVMVEKVDDNSDELAEINAKSIEGTNDLINYNEEVLEQLEKAIAADPTNVTLKMSRNQTKAALESAKANLRQLEYQTDENNPPADLSNLQKDTAIKQIELQEKALDLNKEILKLQLDLARIQESLLYPSAPFTGTVQQIFVNKGQMVSPGTPIATIVGDSNDITATAYVSKNIAKNVSVTSPSEIVVDDNKFELAPSFVSNEATRETLYTILYDIPEEYNAILGNKEFVMVKVPLGYSSDMGNSEGVYVPIDAVHNTQTGAYVLVVEEGTARTDKTDGVVEISPCVVKSRKVEIGPLYGQFAYIYNGLSKNDYVILDRNVVEGDYIKTSDVSFCSN